MKKLRLKKQRKVQDTRLFILTLFLTVLGLIAVADASAPLALKVFSDKFYFLKQQVVWGVIGVLLLVIFSNFNYKFWEKIALPFFLFSVITLIVVLIPGVSSKILGARRWMILGPISFQPSELVKLSLACYLAKIATKDKKIFTYLFPIGVVALLVMLQPDLGTAIIISTIGLTQAYIAGVNIFYLFGAVVIAALFSLVFIVTSDYRKARLLTFLSQTQDPLGKGYHIRQILFALGAGGIFGVGLGKSRQKYLFLPEAATDSIFAVIAEEVGFVGALLIILLFIAYIYIGLRIMKNAPDKFSQILSAGIIVWIGGQALLNMGSMVALSPLTGIPLPFFSYGGSSLTTVLSATGILLNISRYESRPK